MEDIKNKIREWKEYEHGESTKAGAEGNTVKHIKCAGKMIAFKQCLDLINLVEEGVNIKAI